MKTFTIDYITFTDLLTLVQTAWEDEQQHTLEVGDDIIQVTIYRDEVEDYDGNLEAKWVVAPIAEVNGETARIENIDKVNADLMEAQA